MDNALQALLSWQFLLFCLGMFTLTFILRRFVEYFVKTATTSRLWNVLLLPIIPPILGGIVAIIASKYAYPDGLNSFSGRVLFGSVSGLLSGLVYKVIKGMLKSKLEGLESSVQTNANTGDVVTNTFGDVLNNQKQNNDK